MVEASEWVGARVYNTYEAFSQKYQFLLYYSPLLNLQPAAPVCCFSDLSEDGTALPSSPHPQCNAHGCVRLWRRRDNLLGEALRTYVKTKQGPARPGRPQTASQPASTSQRAILWAALAVRYKYKYKYKYK